ncbi:MAG TPA: YihY/virulence factor BrkB family protein [Gaiellaceae bacterium]|nr:YihY/virulence factor BrkB family protein [Gaiellaceae bacterium]
MGLKQRIDNAQQRRRNWAVALATVKKFSEDRSSNLASMIAFWAFFSIFPLFLVGVTVLGFVLHGHTHDVVLRNVAELFPLLNLSKVSGLSGSWWAIVVGGATALWSGLSVAKTTQVAFNSVWEIPEKDRPGMVERVWRSVAALSTIGVGLVGTTLISGFVTGNQSAVSLAWWARIVGYAIAIALDVGLFLLAFRLLTTRRVTFHDVLPGALIAGLVFWVLQEVSSLIISRELSKTQSTYGNFATVITILWWFYLQAQVTLLGAQLNVVLKERLYPRSLFGGPSTEGDYRAFEAYAEEATYHEREEVQADFSGGPEQQPPQGPPPARRAGSATDRR